MYDFLINEKKIFVKIWNKLMQFHDDLFFSNFTQFLILYTIIHPSYRTVRKLLFFFLSWQTNHNRRMFRQGRRGLKAANTSSNPQWLQLQRLIHTAAGTGGRNHQVHARGRELDCWRSGRLTPAATTNNRRSLRCNRGIRGYISTLCGEFSTSVFWNCATASFFFALGNISTHCYSLSLPE